MGDHRRACADELGRRRSTGASREALAAIEEDEAYYVVGITSDLVAAGRRLRWVHSAAAGVGNVLKSGVADTDILLTNASGHPPPSRWRSSSSPACSTSSAGSTSRSSSSGAGSGARRSSSPTTLPLRELEDCRVLIVGTGGIGQATAVRMAAFGAACVGVSRRPEQGVPAGFERVVGPDQLDEKLRRADVLILAAPLTGPDSTGHDPPRGWSCSRRERSS